MTTKSGPIGGRGFERVGPSMGGEGFVSGTLGSGTAVIVPMRGAPLPATVWVNPAAGDTVTVTYSCDGGTTYTAWAAGSVTAYTETVFDSGITHLKFQRTAGTGTTSTYGVC